MSANLTPEQMQLRYKLNKLGLDESAIHKGVICTDMTPGPTYLSTNPDFPSFIQPHMIRVHTVDELKQLGGIPDENYENGLMLEHHNECLNEWNSVKNALDKSELSFQEQVTLCKAFTTYIYGNSNKVQSYKKAINQYFFPLQLALFLGEDVVVAPGHPLIIESTGDMPVGVHFNSVTIKSGGEIINKAKVKWEVSFFKQEPTDSPISNFLSIGTNGGDSGTPGPQGKADRGDKGQDGVSEDKKCKTDAGKGGTGKNGEHGKPGSCGGNGGDSSEVVAKLIKVSGPIVAMSVGGNGGNGGNGGKGGDGGDGGPGGSATSYCKVAGEQGKGGNGGDGGTGGKGGNGGNGKNVYIFYEELEKGGSISLGDPKGYGQGGKGGNGGDYGNAGNGIPNGKCGQGGDAGAGGTAGVLGTVFINNQPINNLR